MQHPRLSLEVMYWTNGEVSPRSPPPLLLTILNDDARLGLISRHLSEPIQTLTTQSAVQPGEPTGLLRSIGSTHVRYKCRGLSSLPSDSDMVAVSLAAAYADAYPHTKTLTQQAPYDFVGNMTVKDVTDAALNLWLNNDFTQLDCLDKGGVPGYNCPCGTPGFWNTNW